ncbi:MAG TPA: helix-turn-helix domain-containing protein [Verrucomicrobiota bacterium]|nr:helix-turn-helix domain-containing protein [Verrucomicrobiota bacterium]HNU52954.1 helix-turn-helix domain-containing protein [Verrucomicrobiota bacterium]
MVDSITKQQAATENRPQRYLDKAGAAELLGVSRRTIDVWIRRGILPYFRLGPKLVRFSPDDLAEHLQRNFRVAGRTKGGRS